MKIVVFSETFFPILGGLERNCYSLANALIDMNYDVELLTTTPSAEADNYDFKVIRSRSMRLLIAAISRADLLIANGGLPLKIILPAYLLRKKYIIVYQTSSLFQREGGGMLATINNAVRSFLARRTKLSIGVSEYATRRLRSKGCKAGTLINPVDRELEEIFRNRGPVRDDRKKYDLLFAGRIIEGKGIFVLAEALFILKSQFNFSLQTAIAGSGSDSEKFSDYCNEKGIILHFLGRKDKHELIDAYLSSRLLVVPSSSHIEGNPLVIAEALFGGIPVIVSDQPAMIEAVGDAGKVFKNGDAKELAQIIYELLTNEQELARITANALKRKDIFSYSQYTKRLQLLLNISGSQSSGEIFAAEKVRG